MTQYGSGTTNISIEDHQKKHPWLYITGAIGHETDGEKDRYKGYIADALTEYLNGGPKPQWLSDGEVRENSLEFADGLRITVMGPMVDVDPPKMMWVQDESPEAKQMRIELLEMLT